MFKPTALDVPLLRRNPRDYAANLNQKQLLSVLKYLDYMYHEKSKPVIKDEVYDVAYDVFAERWPKHKYLSTVGSKATGDNKVVLPFMMPSLDKMKPDNPKLNKFLTKGPYVVSDKLDGISLMVVYDNGVPVEAYTRGNGKQGKDVSRHIQVLRIPKKISQKRKIVVRLEVVIATKTFSAKFSKKSGGDFEAARNMAGGLLNRKQSASSLRSFKVIAHEIINGPGAGTPWSKQFTSLKALGFDVVTHKKFNSLDVDILTRVHNLRRSKSPYGADGIVVAYDKPYARTTSGHPTYVKAFKINSLDDMVKTTVLRVEWNQSINNKLVPTVITKPVRLADANVQRFTGFNAYFILNGIPYKDRNIGHPKRPIGKGAIVKVIRSGDVIPYIAGVVKGVEPQLPDVPYEIRRGIEAYAIEQTDTVDQKKLVHFFSTLGAEGIKRGTVSRLWEHGYTSIQSYLDLDPNDLVGLEGIQESKAVTIYKAIQAVKKGHSFAKLGDASGVFGESIAESTLASVYEKYPNIMQMINLDKSVLVEAIEQVDGIKSKAVLIAEALPKFRKFLRQHGLKLVKPKTIQVTGNELENKVIVLTGFRDQELKDAIIQNGGTVASGLSSKVNLLVVKDGSVSNNKTEKAIQQNIEIQTAQELRKRLGL